MGIDTCNVCHGLCYLPSGTYENCNSCGGRGYGASSDTSCMDCGGSGQSTTEIQDTCWNCHGSGTVSTPDQPRPPPTPAPPVGGNTKGESNSPPKKANDLVSENISKIALLLAAIAGFVAYHEKSEFGPALGVAFAAFIASGLALYVAYYAIIIAIEILKFVIVIVFWGAIIIFVSNLLGFDWAVDIVNRIDLG